MQNVTDWHELASFPRKQIYLQMLLFSNKTEEKFNLPLFQCENQILNFSADFTSNFASAADTRTL